MPSIKLFLTKVYISRFGKVLFNAWFWIGLVVAFGLFMFVTIEVTGQNIFCGSCHEMREHFRTWEVSSHKDVKCIKCHISPGVVSMVKRKMAGLRELYVHFTEEKTFEEIRGHVPDRNCTRCHEETEDLIVYHSLKITHKSHWDRGIDCVTCHSLVVHGPRAEYKNTPSMETCYTCHDGEQAPNDCSTCHVTLGLRRPSAFNAEWVEAHKLDVAQNKDTCKRCHHQDFCRNCHMSAKPHPGNWISMHNEAAGEDYESCMVCHKERYCTNCHQIRKTHELNWIEGHQAETSKDAKECAVCHRESFCADCHTKFVRHPEEWMETHGETVEKRPESCAVCHTEEFCATCHE